MCIIYFLCLVATYLLSLGKIFRVLQLSFNISLSLALAIVFSQLNINICTKLANIFRVSLQCEQCPGLRPARQWRGSGAGLSPTYPMVTCHAPRHAVSRGAGWKHHNMTHERCPAPAWWLRTKRSAVRDKFFPQVFATKHKIYGGVGGSEETKKTAEASGGLQLYFTLTDHNP